MVVERRRTGPRLYDSRVNDGVDLVRRYSWLRHLAAKVEHITSESARLSHGGQAFRGVQVYLCYSVPTPRSFVKYMDIIGRIVLRHNISEDCRATPQPCLISSAGSSYIVESRIATSERS